MSEQPMSEQPMSEEPVDETELPDSFHRNRREHAGAPRHLDEDRLARLTEEEREEAGVGEDEPARDRGDGSA